MVKLWRKNFEIKRVDLNIMTESQLGFYALQTKTINRKVLKNCLWIIENLDNTAAYFLKDELREIIEFTIQTIISKPGHIDVVHKQTIGLNKKYFALAEHIRKLDLSRFSNKSLIKLHSRLYKLQYLSHGWALPTTWFVDSDGEDFTKYLLGLLKDKISPQTDIDLASAFSMLTTMGRRSFGTQEEQESLKIIQFVKSDKYLKKWFISHTTNELVEQFNKLPALARRRLYKHFLKWCWFPYTYLGPAYDLTYYLEVWRGLLHEDINPQQELRQFKSKVKSIKQKRKQLISTLRLSKQEKHLFDIAAEIVWLKGYRKDCYFHGFYALDFILTEIAKRAGLSLLQTKYLLPEELPLVLRGRDLAGLTNERMKFCVIYFSKGKLKVITGVKAKHLLKRQKIEKEKRIKLNNLLGTCACPGKAKGIAKIINVPEDIPKMKSGDIMISHTTFPSLVPAMKKAAAIVTEDGGITCHAAIVARELQTPCIVGCSGILRAIKGGDMVEVDANKGIITKL